MAPPNDAAFKAKLLLRTHYNQLRMLYLLASMLGLLLVFSAGHFLRRRRCSSSPHSLPVRISRCFRSFSLRSGCRGVPTVGHGLIIILYGLANLVVFLIGLDDGGKGMATVSNVGSRTAWLALGNLVIVILLALKITTPLVLLTGRSYDRLNLLHRVAGSTTVALVIIHASCYADYFVSQGRSDHLVRPSDICGIVAGLAMVGLAAGGFLLRRRFYDAFYYLHVALWLLVVVMTALHQPDLDKHAVVALVGSVAGLWALDRLLRFLRFAMGAVGNSATLTSLPDGSTRVVLAKPPPGAVSGTHCFLWLPAVRSYEVHPFTLAALDPPELVVGPAGGYTRALHAYADARPGRSGPLSVAVEGPYGAVSLPPASSSPSSAIFVAGGSGITYTLGTALDLLRRSSDGKQRLLFIWVAKTPATLDNLRHRLAFLCQDARVTIRLYVSKKPRPLPTSTSHEFLALSPPATHEAYPSSDPEKASAKTSDQVHEVLATRSRSTDVVGGIPITFRRPDVAALIRDAIQDTPSDGRAVVFGCGPEPLMTVVRNTTAACIQGHGPDVGLHIESFGL
ncbi:hypothetical protein L249_4797 [Ophiocordyceps polyrhachis-furcata BCC 54312]|uniref:FAD-binding FR-type domain-containing protein n=1 Tax=Ophiocordyceps polyrhachis-furcata BCC 54312 TaxID=1330021 RepID=A0A367L2L7_9HYPO|nr:hypothetical protein L249_4797 [Ophiocordyceps polyrhachis-furcata BCC 54312]